MVGCALLGEVSAGMPRVAYVFVKIYLFVVFGCTGSHGCTRGPSLVAASGVPVHCGTRAPQGWPLLLWGSGVCACGPQ